MKALIPLRLTARTRAARALMLALLATVSVSACKEIRMPGVYRIDIQQGNVITQEQLAALESGMEKRKVRFILGTPLVTDTFNQDRWDYYYSLEERGEDRVQRIISVFFKDERLTRVTGDVRAASGPIELPERVDKVVTVPDGYRNEGLFASLAPDFLSDRPKRQKRPEDEQAGSGDQSATPDSSAAEPTTSDPAATAADAPSASSATGGDAVASSVPAPDSEVPPPPAVNSPIEVDEQDQAYLRDLLGGLGRDAPGTVPMGAPANSTTAPAGNSTSTAEEKSEEEGVLSRWAKRLGWGDSSDTPPAPPATQ